MIVCINGSPKANENNSAYFLEQLTKMVDDKDIVTYWISKEKNVDPIMENIIKSDVLLFAFPLYVDSLPSHLIRFLKKLELYIKDKDCKTKVYVIVNCGFYEGSQTYLAIQQMKLFCKTVHLSFGQALGIGSGEMLGGLKTVPIHNGPNKALGEAFDVLATSIVQKGEGEDLFVKPSRFPRFAYLVASNNFWCKYAKKYGNSKYKLKKRLYHPSKPKRKES
ncbi:multimeric flavodoxin WrbA family protein, diverged or disrupted [Lachnospiraceae bacterium KM106-2]|nr:multimeric flavodoxin WrbA family protein, diverged or disrupted [Lachnospiraceae bacterium KM106-2]